MPSSAASERRRLAPEARRTQIVEGAVAYFAEVGLEGTTRDLSRRLGVTQSLIYAYFDTKADLLEAVYRHVYLDRVSPDWPALIADRGRSLHERLHRFYAEYTGAIFTYEWMRIFMFSGLAGAELNRRYLDHLATVILKPMLREVEAAACGQARPGMEDIWNLHGGIVYIGIRKFVYQMPTPEDPEPAVGAAIDRFLAAFEVARG